MKVNYYEAMARLKKGEMARLYLIYGEETYLAQKLEKTIVSAACGSDAEALRVLNSEADVDEVINAVESAPFFSEKNVILIRNSNLLKDGKTSSNREERLFQLLQDMPPFSLLIFSMSEKPDKRKKMFKMLDKCGCAVETAPLKARDLDEWLQVKLKELNKRFDRAAFEYFQEVTSMMAQVSLGFLDQEMEKLALYTTQDTIYKEDLQAIFASLPEVSVFVLLEAISDKRIKLALRLLTEQLSGGEHPLRLVALLTRHTRQLWRVKELAQAGYTSKQIAEKVGVAPFIGEKLKTKSSKFNGSVLRKAFLDLAQADYKLKSGQADCAMLERIIIELCA